MYKIQLVNRLVKFEQLKNQVRIKISVGATRLIKLIMMYAAEQAHFKNTYKHTNYYNADILNLNMIEISREWKYYEEAANAKDKHAEAKAIRLAIKELENEEIIALVPGNKRKFIINPLYYYDGLKFLNTYLCWCRYTCARIKAPYLKECVKEGDSKEFEEQDIECLRHIVALNDETDFYQHLAAL